MRHTPESIQYVFNTNPELLEKPRAFAYSNAWEGCCSLARASISHMNPTEYATMVEICSFHRKPILLTATRANIKEIDKGIASGVYKHLRKILTTDSVHVPTYPVCLYIMEVE
jgi:hypothetical protein